MYTEIGLSHDRGPVRDTGKATIVAGRATLLYWIEVPARLHDFGKKSSAARLFKAARYDGNHKIQVTLERIADLKKKKTRVKCEFFKPCFVLFTFYLNMGDTHFFFESWKYFRNFPQSWNFARRVSPHENITKTLKIKQIQVFKLSYNIYLYHSFSFKITVHPKCIASQHLSFKLKKIQNA